MRPLELLKPHVPYPLPDLSRHDFDLILQHRQVSLSSVEADRFYEAMQQNALYLDLVAKELVEQKQQPLEELIERLTENPEHLFSLTIDRFFAQDEIEGWHLRVTRWCEQSDIMTIWQDALHDDSEQGRRLYARHYYLTYVYYARQWSTLFAVLDAGTFGHAKLENDPSMRSYALDLTWGERAATWKSYSLKQGIDNLSELWHYSLLRCRIAAWLPPGGF